jgi:hypothetical protein
MFPLRNLSVNCACVCVHTYIHEQVGVGYSVFLAMRYHIHMPSRACVVCMHIIHVHRVCLHVYVCVYMRISTNVHT